MMMAYAADPDPAGRPDLFRDLMTPARARRAPFAAPVSLVVHAVALSLLIAVSLARLESTPVKRDLVHIPLYGPPPAPPLPLPKGNGGAEPVHVHVVETTTPAFTAPVELAPVEPVAATVEESADTSGSALGAAGGTWEGTEAGRAGGVVDGVPWGQAGGVANGTGDTLQAVANPDSPPRLLRRVAPKYPQPAFVQRVQGRVVLQILIDSSGRVADAKVTESNPLLDAAAREAVLQWEFAPALKDGRPVATWATAPVIFRLF